MRKNNFVLPVIVLAAVCIACTFLKDKFADTGGAKPPSRNIADAVQNFDINAPRVLPGAFAIRRLAELDPTLASFESSVQESERAAMRKMIASLPANDADKSKERTAIKLPAVTKSSYVPRSPAALMMFQAGQAPLPGGQDGAFVGVLVGGMKKWFSEMLAQGAGHVSKTETETVGDTTTTMNAELGSSSDGSTVFGMGIKSETTKNGVKVVSELDGKIDGYECPNAEGQLPITVKVRLTAQSGGTGYSQEITAFVRVVVDDNAKIATTTIDATQGTRQSKAGREVYVETGITIAYDRDDIANFRTSNLRVNQKTDNATFDEIGEISTAGHNAAFGAADGAIAAAQSAFYEGRCVQIEAKSPGQVGVNSVTQIPVKVMHKRDGSEVPSKLTAELSGGASVNPTVIAKTAGTLTYTAPAESGKSATIKLTATSRRGRATLDLTASTGAKRSYHVEGSSQGAFFKGDICDLNKPFTINVDSKTGKWPMEFTPESDSAGTMKGTFSSNGCTLTGGGPYTISIGEDGSGTITFTYNSTATCPMGSTTTSRTSTLPLKPAPDLSCP